MLKKCEINSIIIELINNFYEKDLFWRCLIKPRIYENTKLYFDDLEYIIDWCDYYYNVDYNNKQFWLEMKTIYNDYFLPKVENECDEICEILSDPTIVLENFENTKIAPLKYRVMVKYLAIKTRHFLEDLLEIKGKDGLIKYQALTRGHVVRWEYPCFSWKKY
jgi:hypothetical protein